MQVPNSPLFPASQLKLSPAASNKDVGNGDDQGALVPQLPEKPLSSTSSIQVYIIPTEKTLFVQGFEPHEYAERPPTLLRGCLYIRILKPCKIKAITLTFKGQQKTDWPEGIPPKKTEYAEVNDIVSHTWPFYQSCPTAVNGGSDFYRELPKSYQTSESDVSHLSLGDSTVRSLSPMPPDNGNFFTRSLSPATNFMKRAASPSAQDGNSFSDLNAVLTAPDLDPSKPGHFPTGDYMYNFEHPLHPSIPESTSVTFGSVNYYLEATVIRQGTFKSNLTGKLPIEIIRTLSDSNVKENEPIIITRDWEDQLRYDIVIGGKCIVLDSYLPMAFRFVPLWGKVALHRIRVYLTETLEYYCQNKKVHRMEPSKKYLLLEHKAQKGNSLLSKDSGQNETEQNDDEILPKELEFQLYVPKVLNDRYRYEIHPDTSFTTIQSHHWIKICLRISKLDPENAEKRKHYEISIDSPIHILSPLAAHGNTLLPAYDDFIPDSNFLPTYTPSTPPLSPGVTPVESGHGFLSVFKQHTSSTTNSNSLDEVMEHSPHPPEFHHINTQNNNDDPIERDADMHLEANLYKPSSDCSQLNSPQALPHPDTFHSPIMSPIQRPIHLIRKPSINPPPFDADIPPPALDNIPPPAYEEEESSLSPLRISDAATSERGRRRESSTMLKVTPPSPILSEPVKDLLNHRLKSNSEIQSNMPSNKIEIQHQSTRNEEEDIADSPKSPFHPPQTLSPTRNSHSTRSSISSIGSAGTDLPIEQTLPLLSLSTSSLNNNNINTNNINSHNCKSRNSSVISLLNDLNKRSIYVPGTSTRMNDIVDGEYFNDDLYKINDNLLQLRNPRIKKHYQEENQTIPTAKQGQQETDDVITKLRQKSFGVINNINDTENSDASKSLSESNSTINIGSNSRTISKTNDSTKTRSPGLVETGTPVPGFKYSYIID